MIFSFNFPEKWFSNLLGSSQKVTPKDSGLDPVKEMAKNIEFQSGQPMGKSINHNSWKDAQEMKDWLVQLGIKRGDRAMKLELPAQWQLAHVGVYLCLEIDGTIYGQDRI